MTNEEYKVHRLRLWREPEILLAARLIYGEARGTSKEEQIAVAYVVRNRSLKPGWWGRNVREVILARKQFSCFNAGDPNFARLLTVPVTDAMFLRCAGIAGLALAGAIPDTTDGADHYHSRDVSPDWARAMRRTHETASFIFYRS